MPRNHGLIVDDQLEMLVEQNNLTFSQLFAAQVDGQQQREEKRFSLSEEENPLIMFSMKKFKAPPSQSGMNIKILTAVFERNLGFLTPGQDKQGLRTKLQRSMSSKNLVNR